MDPTLFAEMESIINSCEPEHSPSKFRMNIALVKTKIRMGLPLLYAHGGTTKGNREMLTNDLWDVWGVNM